MLERDTHAAHGECLVVRARASGAERQSMDLSEPNGYPFIGVPY